MRLFKRRKIWLIPLGILIGFTLFLHSCMTFRMSSREVDEYFSSRKIPATQHQYKSGFRDIHYVESGDTLAPLVLFVHGSPGSLSAFIHFLADSILLQKALLITTDRPGFGYSNFGNAEKSLVKQGEALKPILERHQNNRPIILVGHSLGGPLIARMAMQYPDLVDG